MPLTRNTLSLFSKSKKGNVSVELSKIKECVFGMVDPKRKWV